MDCGSGFPSEDTGPDTTQSGPLRSTFRGSHPACEGPFREGFSSRREREMDTEALHRRGHPSQRERKDREAERADREQ